MAEAFIDRFDDPAQWVAGQADGAPSSALALASSGTEARTGEPAVRITAGGGATGHRLHRALAAPVDLRPFDDLLLWVRGDRIADGGTGRPFPLELRLGSAARRIDAPSNTWRRFVPFAAVRRWAPVLISLSDVPANVRSALSEVRLVSLAGDWTVELGPVRAVRGELLSDIDAALLARFSNRLALNGNPVAARLLPAEAGPGTGPRFDITAVGVRPNPERARTAALATDFTASGFVLRPAASPLDLTYRVHAVAPDRSSVSRMVQFVLDDVAAGPTIVAAGMPWPVELAEDAAGLEDGGANVTLRIEAAARPPADRVAAIPPFNTVTVEVDQRAAG